jgi:zinc transport system substrate-binding protein
MGKFKFILFVFALVFAGLYAFVAYDEKNNIESEKISVVTTLFPLYDMAKNIGGDNADVYLLLPPGVEAHSYEPTPSDIVRINEADIFIYTGKFMEPWVEDILKSFKNENLIVVDSSTGTNMLESDPHIWLDFDNSKIMADNIKNGYIQNDPENKNYYELTANDYSNKLTELDSLYKNSLSTCEKKEIVYGGHYAFSYLANRYGLTYLAAQGLSPDSEPTANDLIKLIDQVTKNDIKYIFYEELSSPKIAETIANETDAKMLLLNAAHNVSKEQFDDDVSFFDIMDENLVNLKNGLNCN